MGHCHDAGENKSITGCPISGYMSLFTVLFNWYGNKSCGAKSIIYLLFYSYCRFWMWQVECRVRTGEGKKHDTYHSNSSYYTDIWQVHSSSTFHNAERQAVGQLIYPVSILRKSISGRHRPVRVADGPMTARCRFT